MAACKTLIHSSLASIRSHGRFTPLLNSTSLRFSPPLSPNQGLRISQTNVQSRPHASISAQAAADFTADESDNPNQDTVERLLTHRDDVVRMMKMERRPLQLGDSGHWFPYLDSFNCGGGAYLSSGEVLEAIEPVILDERKERFRNVAKNRSYSVCLVVEGLADFGNVSAVFRSADALGIQSVHVLSCDASKRYRENRHVSMGAEKWLDIELWDSTQECFQVLRSRGYRIAIPGPGPTKGPTIEHQKEIGLWAVKLPSADAIVVRRTLGALTENPNGLQGRNESEEHVRKRETFWSTVKPAHFGVLKIGTKSLLGIFRLMIVGLFIGLFGQFAFGRWLLLKFPSFFSVGWFRKEGPSDEEVRSASFKMWFIGRGFSDGSLASQGNTKPDMEIVTRVMGPEIGYLTTPIILLQCALILLNQRDNLPKGGVFPPRIVFGPTDQLMQCTQ